MWRFFNGISIPAPCVFCFVYFVEELLVAAGVGVAGGIYAFYPAVEEQPVIVVLMPLACLRRR